MYSQSYNESVLTNMKEITKSLSLIAKAPLVKDDETAESFAKGIQEISRLTADDREALDKMSLKELKASDYSKHIKTAYSITGDALKSVSDAVSGRASINPVIQANEKAFHTETRNNMDRAVLMVDELSSMMQYTDIDPSWALAFRSVDASGREEVSVSDILGEIRFQELSRTEPPILTSLGSEKSEKTGYRRFGGGVIQNLYDMPISAYTVNEVLSAIRIASLRTRAQVAYKEIFRHGSANDAYAFTPYTGGTDTTSKDVNYKASIDAIHTINTAYRQMIDKAAQIRTTANKKGSKGKLQAPLPVSYNSPVLVYFDHTHISFLDVMRRMIGGEDGNNPRLLYNFVFLPTHLAPASGGWTFGDDESRDDFGIFGKVTESGPISKVAARLVMPGMRNLHATMQGLTFGQETKWTRETAEIAAFERYTFAVDPRQSAKVTLQG